MDEERRTSFERPREDHQEMFAKAFEWNDWQEAKELLEDYGDRIDVDVVWNEANGMTMLMHACLRNWSGMAQVVGRRADWNMTGFGGFTALHMVCLNGNLELAKLALEQGAHINAVDNQNCSSLWFAVMSEKTDLVSYLLQRDDLDLSLVNLPERSRSQTCLYVAARNKSPQIVLDLIEHGADVNQQTDTKTTPIWIASQFGRSSNVRLLLEAGANAKIGDGIGRTPLHMACMDGDLATISVLVDGGCDPLRKTTDTHVWNAVHFAANSGHKHVVEYLVEQRDVDLGWMCHGETPLHRACLLGHEDCARYLVKHGMSHTARNETGETALDIAECAGHSHIADFLRSIEDKTVSVAELDSNGLRPWREEEKWKLNQLVFRENPVVKPIRKVLEHVEKEFHGACGKLFLEEDGGMPDDEQVALCVAPFREEVETALARLVDSFHAVIDKCSRDKEACRLLEEFEKWSPECAKVRSGKAMCRDAGRNARIQHGQDTWDDCVDYLDSQDMKRPYDDAQKSEIRQAHGDDIATLVAWCVWTQEKMNGWMDDTCRHGTTKSHPGRVKSLCRVGEKMAMCVDSSVVWDYVRGMKSFANLQLLCGFLEEITCERTHPEIYVFQVKNRFCRDVDSVENAWQDVVVHFVFTDVPREHRVICELRLTLENILFARQTVTGDGGYARFRNLCELRKAVSSRRP